MKVKGMDGHEYNVTGQGQGNFNTAGGIAGILSLLGFDLGGILGNRYNPNMSPQALVDAMNASRNSSNSGVIEAMLGVIMSLIPTLMSAGSNNNGRGCCSENTPVTRYDIEQSEKMQDLKSENALLKADKYTDQKLVETYKDLQGQIKELAGEVRSNKAAQDAVNLQQAVYNGTNNATLSCIQNQVAQLASLSQLVVPQNRVCQTGCCCNG